MDPGMNRKRRLLALLLSPLLVLIIASLVYMARSGGTTPRTGKRGSGPGTSLADKSWQTAEPVLIEHKEIIHKRQTLAQILTRFDFSGAEIEKLKADVRGVYDPGRITAGHELRLYVDANLRTERLEYDIDEDTYLSLRRVPNGFAAEVKRFPYEIRPALVWGTIEDTPIAAFNKAGEADSLAMDFAEIFAWDVDFYLDPRRGDQFALIVQKKYLADRFVSYGEILAAEYVNAGKLFRAVRYAYPDTGKSDYFDAEGGSMRKEFMKSPLKYARVTSRFTASRFHPILKVYTTHYGVDLAAALGTPVKATAPGTVIFAAWDDGAGNLVQIRHKGGYETMYMHLSRFAEGIRSGAAVEGGQVIGYVGETGEATGPHLDYRITFHGQYINPLGYRFKSADPVRPEYLPDFKEKSRALLEFLSLPLLEMRCFLAAS
jgi:murein DD-endopeptidase MepM/ murein hydrolase activator NlpD